MKVLTKIQVILTVLVVVVFLVEMRTAIWLHSMAYADPVRQEWQPKLNRIGSLLWFGTVIPWLLFTVYHVVIVNKQKRAV